jgi:hypothetical protein
MKLWETVSAFREFPTALAEVFRSDRWSATYGDSFSRYAELVRTQDRATLDGHLPVELTREIAQRCDGLQFCFSPDTSSLRRATRALPADAGLVTLTALDVHDRFGGSVIEEVLEYGSATVPNHAA